MEDWKTYKLSEIGTVVGGATPSTKVPENYDGEISWITPKDLSNFMGRYIFRGERNISQLGYDSCSCQMLPVGTILFSSRAPIGYLAIAGKEVCTNQGFKSIIPNSAYVDSLFLYYLLKYHKDRIADLGSGTTFMEVSGSVMRNVEVSIPDLLTQKRIARLLSSIDDKIELNNRINHNLEEQAQALYKSWFVDFEPFKDGKFVDSELGMIPEGWRIGKVRDLIDIQSGFAFKSDTFVTSGRYRLITIKAVQDGYLTTYGADYIDNPLPAKMPEYCKLALGDILLSLTGNVGRICIVDDVNLLLNQRVAKLQPINVADRAFVYTLFRNMPFREQVVQLARGTAQLNLSPVETGELSLCIPSRNVLQQFADITMPLFEEILSNSLANKRLELIRDSVLPKFMYAKLTC